MIELLILFTIIVIARFTYGFVFTFLLTVGIVLCLYLTNLNISMIFALITIVVPSILKYRKKNDFY